MNNSMYLMKRLRMFLRVLVEAFLGIKHSGWLNVFIVTTLMLMLLSFGVVLGFSLTLKKFAAQLGAKNEFLVHVLHDADVNSYSAFLKEHKFVKKFKFIPKEEVFADTKKQWNVDLDESFNDMPNTFMIEVSNPNNIKPLIQDIAKFNSKDIESIEYVPTLIKQIHGIKNTLIIGGTLFSLLLAITTFIINFNTIELVIRARRNELKLLNFVGVSSWFIKSPFVVQGLVYALSGAGLSVILLSFLISLVRSSTNNATYMEYVLPNSGEFFIISTILLLTAVLFSMSSSLWATEKRLEKY